MARPSRESEPKARLAANLRAARQRAGIGQSEAADRIGVTRQTLSGWERPDARAPWPKEGEIESMAELYGTSPRMLRYGTADLLEDVASFLSNDGAGPTTLEVRLKIGEYRLELMRDYKASDELIDVAERALRAPAAVAFTKAVSGDSDLSQEHVLSAVDMMMRGIRSHLDAHGDAQQPPKVAPRVKANDDQKPKRRGA